MSMLTTVGERAIGMLKKEGLVMGAAAVSIGGLVVGLESTVDASPARQIGGAAVGVALAAGLGYAALRVGRGGTSSVVDGVETLVRSGAREQVRGALFMSAIVAAMSPIFILGADKIPAHEG